MPFAASSSKTLLAFIPLLILPYSFNTQALSATTANTIQGTAPYLTFDVGTTKVTTTDGLLIIKLSDGTIPTPNSTTPITLPVAGETFADIEMLVPAAAPPVSASDPTQTISLTDAIGAPNNYWGDDDGDGQGTSGITATGSLSVVITDKNGAKVKRSDMPSACSSPYTVVLSSTAGVLSTQYGDPNSSPFSAATATYIINPAAGPAVCFAKPDMANATGNFAGPASMWNTTKGFITQSTSSLGYGSNFPTTGANGLYFELDISGVTSALAWTTVSVSTVVGDITATPSACATPSINCIKYTLTGPAATAGLMSTASPGALTPTPTLPATLELEGKSGGTTVVKYGFTIKKWYVNRGTTLASAAAQNTWCTGLGYRLAKVEDLTNAAGVRGSNNLVRYIDQGLFSEWGRMGNYTGSGFIIGTYWTSDLNGTMQYVAQTNVGGIASSIPSNTFTALCTLP